MSKIDLKSGIPFGHSYRSRGVVYEHGSNDFCAINGSSSARRISPLCGALRRRLQSAKLLLPGPVSVPGLCPTHLSRESARHRDLLACPWTPTLSHGFSRWHLAQQSRPRQPAARLADLCRFRARAHCPGAWPLPARTFGVGVGTDGLRLRFHHYRFVSVAFSLGTVSAAQECGEAAHLARPARTHSHRCLCDRRAGERCEAARPTGLGSGSLLSPRPRLYRLPPPVSDHPSAGFLRHPSRSEPGLPCLPAAGSRSAPGAALRSNHSPDRTQEFASLPRTPAAHPVRRHRKSLAPGLPHQQFSSGAPAHRPTLPRPLASRVVLSLDQTASAYPRFLRYLGECREDASVGGDQRLRPRGHPQKATPSGPQPAQNPANSERHDFRKKPNFTGFLAIQRANSENRPLYPIGSVQLMMGQY